MRQMTVSRGGGPFSFSFARQMRTCAHPVRFHPPWLSFAVAALARDALTEGPLLLYPCPYCWFPRWKPGPASQKLRQRKERQLPCAFFFEYMWCTSQLFRALSKPQPSTYGIVVRDQNAPSDDTRTKTILYDKIHAQLSGTFW